MTIQVLRPSADSYKQGVTFSTGAAIFSLIDDGPVDDTTYISAATSTQYPNDFFHIHTGDTVTVTATQRVLRARFRARIRISAAANGASAVIKLANRNPYDGVLDFLETFSTSSIVVSEKSGVWRSKPPVDKGKRWGTEWTKVAVDAMHVHGQFFYSWNTKVNLRLTELYLDVDVRDQPTITGTPSVTGHTSSTNPAVAWVYAPNADGDPQTAYRVKVFTAAQYGAAGFSAATSTPTFDSGELGGAADSYTVGQALLNGVTYRMYVGAAQDFNGAKWYTTWTPSDVFTIGLTPPATPTLTVTPDQSVPWLRNALRIQGNINLLSADDASMDTTIGTWQNDTNATTTRTTAQAAFGVGAMSMVAIAAATMSSRTASGVSGYKVKAGTAYTLLASFRTAVTARTCKVGAVFYTRTGVAVGAVAYGTGVTDSTSGWTQASYAVTAPATAVYVAVYTQVTSAALGEVHYVDKVLIGTNVVAGAGGGGTGTTAPVVAQVALSAAFAWNSSAATRSAILTGVPAGALLVATIATGNATASSTNNTISNTGTAVLTWTEREETDAAGTNGDAAVFTANVVTAGDYTVTAADSLSAQSDARMAVYAITGHDEAVYGGAHNKAQATSGSTSVSLTTTRDNSLVIGASGDWNEQNGASRVYREAPVTEDLYADFGGTVCYLWHYTRATAGAANVGTTAPTGMAYGAVALEVRGITGAGGAQSGWSPGGQLGFNSTIVERNWATSGPRNLLSPQLWGGGDETETAGGFFASGTNSTAAYDTNERYLGAGSIRWNVNNIGTKLYFGWVDVPTDDLAPLYALAAVPGKVYTFSCWMKAGATFSSVLNVQALDQLGVVVGSPVASSGFSITTGWTQQSVTITAPAGAVYVRANLDNTAAVTEAQVWVDGLQWVAGSTVDTVPGRGMGLPTVWVPIRGADSGELILSADPGDQITTLFDVEVPPGYTVTYRARNYSPATALSTALESPTTTYVQTMLTPPGAGVWVIKDPARSTSAIQIHVVAMPSEAQSEDLEIFHPLRPDAQDGQGQRGVVVSDFMGGYDGELTVVCDSEAEWLNLMTILAARRVLFLVFPEFGGRHIRLVGRDWSRVTPRTGAGSDSIWRRPVKLPFIHTGRLG